MISTDVIIAFGSLALTMGATVTAFLVKLIRAHATAQQVETGEKLAGIAVRAAEQMSAALGWDGKAKLKGATEDLKNLLSTNGIQISDDQMRSVIESSVKLMKDAEKALNEPRP